MNYENETRESVAPQFGPRHRQALTLVEVVISTLIVAVMTVAALNGLGATTRSSAYAGNRAVALGLADDLMAEILSLPYSDPNQTAVFGLESGESGVSRTGYDDIDDYNNFSENPPKDRNGTTIADRTDFTRTVTITRVVPTNPTQSTATDQGAKCIRVRVSYKGTTLADEWAIKTDN